MTNREKYFNKDAYDILMTIRANTGMCAVDAVGGEMRCEEYCNLYPDCKECYQDWLNQETDQPKPQWQDAMMKNFLRR